MFPIHLPPLIVLTPIAFTIVNSAPNTPPQPDGAVAVGTGDNIDEARKSALENARQDALKKGVKTDPVIKSESYESGRYLGILEYPKGVKPSNEITSEALPEIKKKAEKPNWIIVIALERDGGKTTWNKNSTWTQSWIAPTRINGMRVVSTRGDADDHDKLTSEVMASPGDAGKEASYIAGKYGAPAVAFVRVDKNGNLEAWIWRNGEVVDTTSSGEANVPSLKKASMDMLGSLVETEAISTPVTSAPIPEKIIPSLFLAEKKSQGNQWSVVLLCDTTDQLEQNEAKRVTRNISGLDIQSYKANEDGLSIIATWTGSLESLHTAILKAGATLEE